MLLKAIFDQTCIGFFPILDGAGPTNKKFYPSLRSLFFSIRYAVKEIEKAIAFLYHFVQIRKVDFIFIFTYTIVMHRLQK